MFKLVLTQKFKSGEKNGKSGSIEGYSCPRR